MRKGAFKVTREEFLSLKTAPEMWKAIVAYPELRTKELCDVFQHQREKEFEERIIKRCGSYDPNTHYEILKRKK